MLPAVGRLMLGREMDPPEVRLRLGSEILPEGKLVLGSERVPGVGREMLRRLILGNEVLGRMILGKGALGRAILGRFPLRRLDTRETETPRTGEADAREGGAR